jgi:hypothetical protein
MEDKIADQKVINELMELKVIADTKGFPGDDARFFILGYTNLKLKTQLSALEATLGQAAIDFKAISENFNHHFKSFTEAVQKTANIQVKKIRRLTFATWILVFATFLLFVAIAVSPFLNFYLEKFLSK